jgi:hypothetical protein
MAWDAVAELGIIDDARRRQRHRRRWIGGALVAVLVAAGVGYIAAGPGRDAAEPAGGPRAVAPGTALAQTPYMAVSCAEPNGVACDRIGLAVWLRRPARSVTAVVAGRRFALDDPGWSGPRRAGRRAMFAGFLQPAGIVDRLGARPDRSGRWLGARTPISTVRLRIDFGPGDVAVTRVDVPLMAGWG